MRPVAINVSPNSSCCYIVTHPQACLPAAYLEKDNICESDSGGNSALRGGLCGLGFIHHDDGGEEENLVRIFG